MRIALIFSGGPYGPQGEENQPPRPPTAWQSMLHAIGGVVHFFGRISFLVDENAHAFHFFITALLQLLDRYILSHGPSFIELYFSDRLEMHISRTPTRFV